MSQDLKHRLKKNSFQFVWVVFLYIFKTDILQRHKPVVRMVLPEVHLDKVVVHPLVLLSVVDHFNRMGKIGNEKRVVGVLLGNWTSKWEFSPFGRDLLSFFRALIKKTFFLKVWWQDRMPLFLFIFIFYNIHSFNHNTFIRRHSLKPLFVFGSFFNIESLRWKILWVILVLLCCNEDLKIQMGGPKESFFDHVEDRIVVYLNIIFLICVSLLWRQWGNLSV